MTKDKQTNSITNNKINLLLSFQIFWYFLGQYKTTFIFCIIFIALSQLFIFTNLNQIALLINYLAENGKNSNALEVSKFGIAIVGFTALSEVLATVNNNYITKIKVKLVSNIKKDGMQKLMEFPLQWHQQENSGNKVQRINEGAEKYVSLLSTLGLLIIPSIINLLSVLIVLSRINTSYCFLFLTTVVALFVNERYFAKKSKFYSKKLLEVKENNSGLQFETATNILTTKANNAISKINMRINNSEDEVANLKLTIRKIKSYKLYVFYFLSAFLLSIYIFMIYSDFVVGLLLIGNISIMFKYYSSLTNSSYWLAVSTDEAQESMYAVNRMYPIFNEKPDNYFGNQIFPTDWQKISIKDAKFTYSGQNKEQSAIQSISLTINKNDKIGIVGHSGSGKSTLAKLLIGLYQLESGDFKIGDTNYYDIDHKNITDNISIVLQETELFNMSFKENITLLKDLDIELFQKAVRISQLEELLEGLPEGLETKLGEKGHKLSGGQKQRIGIARAIYTNAPVIIFDEATSALDTKTEELIQQQLDTELENKTLIFIAHRLSTLKNMNRIIVFENGNIIEDGNFNQLVEDNKSVFYELWHSQTKSNPEYSGNTR